MSVMQKIKNLSKEIEILKSAVKALPETKELKDMLSKI